MIMTDVYLCKTLGLNDMIIRLFCVYFPCYDTSVDYSVELGYCLGFIESNLMSGTETLILGDTNFKVTY